LVATLETSPAGHLRPSEFLLSVVVPCFNEERVISLTYPRLVEVKGNGDFGLQMVFVDDGSADRTPETLAGFSRDHPRVKTVFLSRNFGHQAAVSAGLANADGDAVVVIDADLQAPPRSSSR
jgi:polyisoprenyl-phosphate glycosyltransferase